MMWERRTSELPEPDLSGEMNQHSIKRKLLLFQTTGEQEKEGRIRRTRKQQQLQSIDFVSLSQKKDCNKLLSFAPHLVILPG